MVFDKTGTVTKGVFEVSGVYPASGDGAELLELAALAESFSSHPISRSLKAAYGAEIDSSRVTEFRELRGLGVKAAVDGVSVAAGNGKLLAELGIDCAEPDAPGTVVHLAAEGQCFHR